MNMLSVKDVAKEFNLSKSTISNLCRCGKLTAIKLNAGKATRFTMILKDDKFEEMRGYYENIR